MRCGPASERSSDTACLLDSRYASNQLGAIEDIASLRDFSPIPTTRQTCLVVLSPAHVPIVKTGEQGPSRWGTKDTTVIIVKFDPLLSQLVDVRRLNQLLPIVAQQAGPQIKHRQIEAAESANELAY